MSNLQQLTDLFSFLKEFINYRVHSEVLHSEYSYPQLVLNPESSFLQNFILDKQLKEGDILALSLAIVPHVLPQFIENAFLDAIERQELVNEFGGVRGKQHLGILPTGEMLLFLLAGSDLQGRLKVMSYFSFESRLFRENTLRLEYITDGEPGWSGKLVVDEELLEMMTVGKVRKPKMGSDFPAQLLETGLNWDNLVLQPKTKTQIREIETWLDYNEFIMNEWGLKNKVKPGLRALFYGPPGTGKTLTVSLLGKYTGRDVYRVDLSLIVSKYIGETEKNLARLFDKAADKDWILFFDEADSIFGKRTGVRDAHDKYANQEVSYLLQRIETHSGLVILASNQKHNIDVAFTRRFQFMIEFEAPGEQERLLLWKDNFPSQVQIQKEISLRELAKRYELTGANIVNIIQYACLKTAAEENSTIELSHIMTGIRREYSKEGKLM